MQVCLQQFWSALFLFLCLPEKKSISVVPGVSQHVFCKHSTLRILITFGHIDAYLDLFYVILFYSARHRGVCFTLQSGGHNYSRD
uniref:Secreted protein n=1 Tax=Ixodes ricinus TaxID=34613 RepID=A0A6B0U920_IXORI